MTEISASARDAIDTRSLIPHCAVLPTGNNRNKYNKAYFISHRDLARVLNISLRYSPYFYYLILNCEEYILYNIEVCVVMAPVTTLKRILIYYGRRDIIVKR